jgi:hypothetical protein
MKIVVAAMLFLVSFTCMANEQEIQRALMQRDQQSAEFAAQLRGQDVRTLQNLHARQLQEAGRPLSPDPEVARQLAPYGRERAAQESAAYVLKFSPPIERRKSGSDPDLRPLPLPGGPRPGVDPVTVQGVGN